MGETTIVQLELDEQDAQMLSTGRTKAFVRDQPCRFEPHGEGDHLSLSWADGQMAWCANLGEAFMLRAYEWANGFAAMMLWDLGHGEWTVLSNRPWPS